MMKRLKNTILFMLFATNTTVAICSDVSPSEHVLFNGRIVPVFANVTRIQHPAESWDKLPMSTGNHEPDKSSTIVSRSFSFAPKEGIYDRSKVHFERLCTISDSTTGEESVTSIVDVDAANGTFIIRATAPDNPDLIFDVPCEFNRKLFRCDVPSQEVDFAFVGLDAVLTIEGSKFGMWKGDKKYVEIPGQTFSCEGTDCAVEPASTLFGTLTEIMPCSSLAIYEYTWQSALP